MKFHVSYVVWVFMLLSAAFALFSLLKYREADATAQRSLRELVQVGEYAQLIVKNRAVVEYAVDEEQLSKDLVYDLLQASGISESSVSSIQSSDLALGTGRFHSYESTVTLQRVGLVQISQLIASAENHHSSVLISDVSVTRGKEDNAWGAVIKLAQKYTKDG